MLGLVLNFPSEAAPAPSTQKKPVIQFASPPGPAEPSTSPRKKNPNEIDLGIPGGSALEMLKNTQNPLAGDAEGASARNIQSYCVDEAGNAHAQGEESYRECMREKDQKK